MNKVLYVFLLGLFVSCYLNAQVPANHFIHIQSADKQPFYIVLNGKTYQSSDSGNIILSKLKEGITEFTAGFPESLAGEQKFSVSIGKKDAGYWLKNSPDKGWVLINRLTKAVIPAGAKTIAKTDTTIAATGSTAFGQMLSDVVDDADLTKTNTPVVKPGVSVDKQRPVQTGNIEKAAFTAMKDSLSLDTTAKEELPAANTKGIIKDSEEQRSDGIAYMFIDFNGFTNDTIRLFIPANNQDSSGIAPVSTPVLQDAVRLQVKQDTIAPILVATTVKPADALIMADSSQPGIIQNPFFKTDTVSHSVKKTEATVDSGTVVTATALPQNLQNNHCAKTVTEADLDKFKKKMVSQSSEQAMIEIVQKGLKGKCIATDQVKSLGGLFLSDQGRYNFYTGIYDFVYDAGNYPKLESQLLDDSFKKQFKKLIRY